MFLHHRIPPGLHELDPKQKREPKLALGDLCFADAGSVGLKITNDTNVPFGKSSVAPLAVHPLDIRELATKLMRSGKPTELAPE